MTADPRLIIPLDLPTVADARKMVERIDDAASFYKIGLELLVKCRCRKVSEVPIRFANRLHGSSKLSLKEQLNYLRHLARLYSFSTRSALGLVPTKPMQAGNRAAA